MWTSVEFYREVLAQTPRWVWLVLLSLLILGARQLRDRDVRPWTVLIAPIVFMFVGVIGTLRSGLALASWAVVALIACALTFRFLRLPKGAHFNAETQRIHLPGGLSSGAWMIFTFLVTYFINVLMAVYPHLSKSPTSVIFMSAIMGSLTGAFFGRALRQFRLR
jgi:hypothetical protein